MTGELWDWPNQQVVRVDQSGPGSDTDPPEIEPPAAKADRAATPKATKRKDD